MFQTIRKLLKLGMSPEEIAIEFHKEAIAKGDKTFYTTILRMVYHVQDEIKQLEEGR